MAICCFAIGFMSEIQAIAQIILITTFLLFIRFNPFRGSYKNIRVKMTAIALIAIPLLINYLSGGNKRKLQLSKTDILSLPAITKSVNIVTHDLVCRWDNIIVHIGNDLEFNAVYAKLFCISVIIFLWILVRRPGPTLSTATQIDIPKKLNVFTVSLLSISIYLSCLLISALFYANMFDTIFDRCKFLGSFMLVLSLMDLFLIAMFSYPSL